MCTVFVCVILGFIESYFVHLEFRKKFAIVSLKFFLSQFFSHCFFRFQLHILDIVAQASEILFILFILYSFCVSVKISIYVFRFTNISAVSDLI